jgi:hypothetical protein
MTKRDFNPAIAREALIDLIAARPLSTESLQSTWNPPDWEQVVEWYDDIVADARKLSTKRYRKGEGV